jgi:RimJ/RimL family protein N-acetyltransferase
MLTLERYHLTLTRVVSGDIELIRQGRNLDHVRLQHLSQGLISKEMQEAWFEQVNNRYSYFFMIQQAGKRVGVVYVRDFTEGMATSTCGVFIWDPGALGGRVPLLAVLIVLDFFFGDLRGGSTESFVLKTNRAAMKMNQFFGFEFEDVPNEDFYRIRMTLERYSSQRQRLLAVAARIIKTPHAQVLRLGGHVSELNFPEINQLLAASPPEVVSL